MSCTFSLFFAPDFDRRDGWGRSWTFCHNGDLKGFQPRLTGVFMPLSQTDSERAFCWLMQELQATLGNGAAPGWAAVAPLLAVLSGDIARHGEFNFLLGDGEALYAHASTRLHGCSGTTPSAACA